MSFTLQGSVHEILDTVNVSPTFRKREFVVTYTERAGSREIQQLIKFETTQDKCELLDGFAQGDTVEVAFNLRGREWVSPKGEKKYFTTLDAWKITRSGAPSAQGHNAPPPPAFDSFEPPAFIENDPNDLPF